MASFRYVVPADYGLFLEDMAAREWNLDKIGPFNLMKLTFTKSRPKFYRYVFDFNSFPKKEYKETYEQFGWERMVQMTSCFIWRKEYVDARPESFTDRESGFQRNWRVRNGVRINAVFVAAALIVCLAGLVISAFTEKFENVWELSILSVLLAAFDWYLFWVVRKINRNIDL